MELMLLSHSCHLRKAELYLKDTVTGQCQSKLKKTEIFGCKRRKFLEELKNILYKRKCTAYMIFLFAFTLFIYYYTSKPHLICIHTEVNEQ